MLTRSAVLLLLGLTAACDADGASPATDASADARVADATPDVGPPPDGMAPADAALDGPAADAAPDGAADAAPDGAADAAPDGAADAAPDGAADASPADASPADASPPDAGSPPTPNVLLVIADDLGVESTPCYAVGGQPAPMPTLEALCARGVVFTEAWVNPVCTPTRATLLTGRYGFRTGVGGLVVNGGPPIDRDEWTLPRSLDRDLRGVRHANIGKWHLSRTRMGRPDPDPLELGWDHYAGPVSGGLEAYDDWARYQDGITEQVDEYATTRLVDEALDWIHADASPWVLWLAFNAPHTPFHLPPDGLHTQEGLSGTAADIRANPRPYFVASLEALDHELGRLLDGLGEEALARTHVVFVGDNGTPRRVAVPPVAAARAKDTLYQGGVRVPLVVAGPAVVDGGRSVAHLVNGVDLYATVLALMGADPTRPEVDGRSLVPLLTDPEAPPIREHAYTELFAPDMDADVAGRTIRDARHKLLRFEDGTEHLYDLVDDPWEARDLLPGADVDTRAIRDRLAAALDAL